LRENLPERLDRLIGKRRMPPVVAFPDCFTRLAATSTSTQPRSVPGRNPTRDLDCITTVPKVFGPVRPHGAAPYAFADANAG
jgi:hypothetical protein